VAEAGGGGREDNHGVRAGKEVKIFGHVLLL
jgi:hypothetical protein